MWTYFKEVFPRGPGYSVLVMLATTPASPTAWHCDRYLGSAHFAGLRVEVRFVNAPSGVRSSVTRLGTWDDAIAGNGKRHKMNRDLEVVVGFFTALDTFLRESAAQFLFFGTDSTVISHGSFRNIFRDLDPSGYYYLGGCGCEAQYPRLDGNAGWVLSRSAAAVADRRLNKSEFLRSLDWRWDVILTHSLTEVLNISLSDASSAFIATDLADADVRLVGTDLGFLITQCRGADIVHCGACAATSAPLHEVGAWPLGDGALWNTPRGQDKLQRLASAPPNWLVQSSAHGRTQICWVPAGPAGRADEGPHG